MVKNSNTVIIIFILVIIISGFLFLIPAYSQLPYLPKTQSSYAKNQYNIKIAANASNNNNNSTALISNYLHGNTNSSTGQSSPNNAKLVIINFDDSHKNQYTYAKPILDKYGFKATFFEVCNWVEAGYRELDVTTNWKDIAALQQDGMDIEAHTMTHPNLNNLSLAGLDYEVGQSKQCLINHGINPTIFAYPNGEGSNNSTVVNTVAKYYNLARTDTKSALTFLHCDGGSNNNGSNEQQTDCRTYFNNGTLTPSNRYSINSWAHKHVVRECIHQEQRTQQEECPPCPPHDRTCTIIRHEYNNTQMFEKFVTAVNSQYSYNKDGIVRAIPIIIYHTIVTYPDLSYSNRHVDTTLNLFDAEMKYLHDNGFKVITMSDLGYDENSKSLYIKGT